MTTIASATPGASRVPKADGAGKLLAGWFTAAVLLTDLGLGAGVAGDLVYGSGANTLARLGIGTAGRLLVAGASAPAWSDSGLSYASSVLTVAGSVPGTPAAGQVFVGGGAIKAGGAISALSVNFSAGSGVLLDAAASTTGYKLLRVTNDGGSCRFGVDGSAGGQIAVGTSAYSMVVGTNGATSLHLGTNNNVRLTIDSAGAVTCTGVVTVPDGSSAPGIRTTGEAHGFGRGSATSLRIYAAGTRAFDVGYSGSASFAIFGAASTGDVGFFHQQADGSIQLCGSTGSTVGGQVRLYGQSHATKANRVEFTSGNTVRAYIDGSGNLICNGTLSATSLTASGLIATRVPFATTGGLLTDSAEWTRPTAGGGSYISHLPTATGTGSAYSTYSILYSNPSGNNNGTLHGAYMEAQSTAANAFNYTSATWGIAGFIGVAQHYGSGTAASVIGGGFGPVARPGCGVVASMAGFKCLLQNLHTSQAVTLGVGAEISSPTNSGGNFGTYKGINIGATGVGTTNCIGIDIGAMTGTGPFAIRTAAGIVSFGDATDASSTSDGSGRFAGGLSVLKNIVNGGFISNLYQSTSVAAIQANTGAGVNIGAGVTDGLAAGFASYPGYNGAFTVTRHNYFTLGNVTLNGSAVCTDACVFRFDANAGTHKAVDSNTTKTSPGTVSAWVKVNINGTVHYMPAYTSKTS